MHALFCYGTLMYRPLLNHLLGSEVDVREASLIGYRCLAVKGEKYPGIVPSTDDCVRGQLVQRIPAGAWYRLDRYEGEFYRRESVVVRRIDGRDENAWAYVFRPRFRSRLGQRAWHYDGDARAYAQAQLAALLTARGRVQ